MKVLIPVIAGQKIDQNFLDKAANKAEQIIILGVFDTKRMADNTGSEITNIADIEEAVQTISLYYTKKNKEIKIKELTQWGEPERVIQNTAIVQKVDKIVVKNTQLSHFNRIVKTLKEGKIEIQVI